MEKPEELDGKSVILALLRQRPVAFYPALARAVGGVGPGLFLGCLLEAEPDGEGWISKKRTEIEQEVVLTRCEQETARRILREQGVITEELRNYPKQVCYQVNCEKVVQLIREYVTVSPKALEAGSRTKPVRAARQKPQPLPVEAMRAMYSALRDATQLDEELNRVDLNRAAARMLRAGKSAADVDRFMQWWPTFWKGQKGQRPTLEDIKQHLGEALTAHVGRAVQFQDQDIIVQEAAHG